LCPLVRVEWLGPSVVSGAASFSSEGDTSEAADEATATPSDLEMGS
jgi:hypothetical protein